MLKLPWYPQDEPGQVVWLTNYRGKIPTHGPTCGLDGGELADMDVDLELYTWVLQTWHPAIKQDLQEATAFKRIVGNGTGTDPVTLPDASSFSPPGMRPPGVLNRLLNQIARMKKNAGYTEAIGQDLRIIAEEDTSEHPVPEFKPVVAQGDTCQCIHITFTKFGHQGVYLESRRNNGAWEFLGIDTETPYDDERPLLVANTAETREYRVRFWDKGAPNGDWSPVQKVTVGA
ncbi:MAG: hypothetical protein HY298_17745 [Verrucomicrobia bacterium]|nr:hypothetical protein [Verrucomicrobiota bacterium]